MKIIRKQIQLKTSRETIPLVLLGDIHLGHINVEHEYLTSVLRYIQTRKTHWIGMGDYLDSITITDRRFNWDSIDLNLHTPADQLEHAIKLFTPIKDQCITLLTGNHEYTLWQGHNSIDYTNAICQRLNIPYGTYDAIILLDLKKDKSSHTKIIKLYIHHGWTGARTLGGISSRLDDMVNTFPMLDIYAMAHTHHLGELPLQQKLEITRINNKDEITHHNLHRILTGGFLRGYVDKTMSYIEQKTYPPTGLGAILLEIQPFRHNGAKKQSYLKITVKTLPNDLP